MPMDLIVPMALGLGGNAVTVSSDLYEKLSPSLGDFCLDARASGNALASEISSRKAAGEAVLVFGVVHPHSAHNYDLRYWLSAVGLDPEADVKIIVVPPGFMPDALGAGKLDGFCVGAPWNSVAANSGSGSILTTKSEIWRSSPEKILAVNRAFADKNPDILKSLIRALVRAAEWCGDTPNHEEMAMILSRPEYLDIRPELISHAIKGVFPMNLKGETRLVAAKDYFIPFKRAATFPWISHGLWFYSQMVRWGHAPWQPDALNDISAIYRPDIYRGALASTDTALPGASSKVEGALRFETPVGVNKGQLTLGPDGFFDEKRFDPEKIAEYVGEQRR
jgi:NitT/TauT family transport system ATP-binding protein